MGEKDYLQASISNFGMNIYILHYMAVPITGIWAKHMNKPSCQILNIYYSMDHFMKSME